MLKKQLEEKLNEYEEIIREIGRWVNPQQYEIDDKKALFHINGIRKCLNEKFYKLEE